MYRPTNVLNIIRKYLISATLVTSDHVSVVLDGGLVHAATTEIVVVRHRTTFGTIKKPKTEIDYTTRQMYRVYFKRSIVCL